jgi:DNA invertase Pin-like site-specific DNA recombinase
MRLRADRSLDGYVAGAGNESRPVDQGRHLRSTIAGPYPRDAYERLLDDITAGRLDAVVVWMEDRSHRQVIELAAFTETCQAAGISRHASVGAEYDLSDPDEVAMLFAVARTSEAEVRRMSIRVKRRLKDLADTGQYHGGPKPYGYQVPIHDEHGFVTNQGHIGKTIIEEEAAVIREAARRIVHGESLRSVVIGLNRRGVPAPRGSLWTRRTLKVVLTHPRVAGLRQHQGIVVGEACWPAILDRDAWERVGLVLLSQDRGRARTTSRRYLLTGLISCGKCGKRLVGQPYPNGTGAYGCDIGTTYRGCGGVRRRAEPVETLIRETIFSRLAENPEILRIPEAVDDQGGQQTKAPAALSIRQAWEGASREWRRLLINAFIESIVVLPQATSRFDPGSIHVTWRIEALPLGELQRWWPETRSRSLGKEDIA